MCRDDDTFAIFPIGEETDIPLTFAWSGISDDQLSELGTGLGKSREAARHMLAAVLVAARAGQWVSYSRNRNFYVGWRRYEGPSFSYRTIKRTVDQLLDLDLIEEQRAKRNSIGWQSRMRASQRLLDETASWGPFVPMLRELIHLKNEEKRRVDYDETDETRRMRGEMARLNEAIGGLEVGISNGTIDFSQPVVTIGEQLIMPRSRSLYRCFNVQWDLGGRAYGGFWQNLPTGLRALLTIDGLAVTEHDYPHLHPQLIYALHGKTLEGDAYEVAGFERKLAKLAWQMMMNCTSRRGAVHEILKAARADFVGLANSFTSEEAQHLLRALEQRHAPVARSFYSIVGRRLQFIDSQLLMRVLDRCLDEGIVGLPIHDSIIATAGRDADRVLEIMLDELQLTLRTLRTEARTELP